VGSLVKRSLFEMLPSRDFRGIFSGDFKNVVQMLDRDLGGAVVEGNIDTEQAVPGCHVENFRG